MERRGLTEKHGGVFALAAKRGSEEASKVRAALALARRLERFPRIWALYEQEGIGTSVIQRVPIEFLEEDEEVWEEILRSHSRSQVDELVKAERARRAPAPAPAPDPEPDPAPGPDPSADASEDDDQLPGQGRLSWGGAGKDGDLEEGTGEEADAAGGLSGHAGNPHPERKSSSKTTGAASSKRKRTVTVELSEEELARLRVVQRERSKAEGRPVSQGEALRMSFLENFLDTRPPGESPATPEERARIRRKAARSGEGPPGGVAFGAPSAGGTHADLRGSPS